MKYKFGTKQDRLEEKVFLLNQIHSTDVVVVEGRNQESCDGDAIVTNLKNFPVGIRTADCLPILVYDQDNQTIAAIHAGWRGLAAGIIQGTFEVMNPKTAKCFLGPCIQVENFEVDQEVIDAFGDDAVFERYKKPHLDLPGTAKKILFKLGVAEENIVNSGECTFGNSEKYFSYRRGDKIERNYSFIELS